MTALPLCWRCRNSVITGEQVICGELKSFWFWFTFLSYQIEQSFGTKGMCDKAGCRQNKGYSFQWWALYTEGWTLLALGAYQAFSNPSWPKCVSLTILISSKQALRVLIRLHWKWVSQICTARRKNPLTCYTGNTHLPLRKRHEIYFNSSKMCSGLENCVMTYEMS